MTIWRVLIERHVARGRIFYSVFIAALPLTPAISRYYDSHEGKLVMTGGLSDIPGNGVAQR